MNFRDALGYVVYDLYCLCWAAPEFILDLFIPFLCEGSVTDNFIRWTFINRINKSIQNEITD